MLCIWRVLHDLSQVIGYGQHLSLYSSANCGLCCKARLILILIKNIICPLNRLSINIDAEIHGKLPKVIILLHFAGQSCDMRAINALSKQYGFKIIETPHAIGESIKIQAR